MRVDQSGSLVLVSRLSDSVGVDFHIDDIDTRMQGPTDSYCQVEGIRLIELTCDWHENFFDSHLRAPLSSDHGVYYGS